MKKLFFAVLLCLAFATVAFAEEPNMVQVSEGSTSKTFLMKGSLQIADPLRAVWVHIEYKENGRNSFPGALKGKVFTAKSRYLYNCEMTRMQVLGAVFYDKDGVVIHQEGEGKVFEIIPESVGELVRSIVCYNYGQPSKSSDRKPGESMTF